MLTWRTVVLSVIAAVTLTAASLWLLMWQPSEQAGAGESQKYPIERVAFTDAQQVEVTVQPGSTRPVNSPVSGTITGTDCKTGTPLTTGSVVLEVNQRPVIAMVTHAPLFRELVGGETGADVEAVQESLRQAGYDVSSSGRYDWATRAAVDAFLRERGIQADQGRPGVLPRTAYVWAPAAAAIVESCPLRVGDAVSEGSPLLALASQNGQLEFLAPAGVPGDRVLVVGNVRVPAPTSPVTDPAAVAAVLATQEGETAGKSAEKKLSAVLELESPLEVFEVPPSALFGIAGESGCVSDGEETYNVTIVSSSLGMSYVTFESEPPDVVDAFADPAASCG